MREVRDRLRALEQIQAPDLRERIRSWEPQAPGTEPSLRRVGIAFLAFLIAAAGIAFAIRAFRATEPPIRPATAIENGKIAFVSDGINLMNPDGSGIEKIRETDPRDFDIRPVWSPDGSRIAFLHNAGGRFELLVFHVASGDVTTVAGGEFDVDSPQWSPDGTRIAFASGNDLFLINADGTGATRLTAGAFPTWSPDGSRIAFESRTGISVVNVDGSGETTLVPDGFLPAWSPSGAKIAFIDADLQVSAVNADGTGFTRLTDMSYDDTGPPAWSPDGSQIAFEALWDGNYDIYLVNADGTGFRNLTGDPGDENVPTWSPDGTKIAFIAGEAVSESPGNTGTFDVYVMNADGTNKTRLTKGTAPAYALSWQPLRTDEEQATPQESPTPVVERGNGMILFRGGREGPSAIYEVRLDGSGLREVLPPPADVHELAWSPDGMRIAWAGTVDGHYGIYVSAPDGSDAKQLTEGANDGWPSWSPDGTQIVFSSTRADADLRPCPREGEWNLTCPTDLYVMSADGSDITRITTDSAPEYDAAWSPDGSRIAFTRSDGYGTAVYVANVDGSEHRQVSSADGGSDFRPSWTPDGDRIVFGSIRYEDWGIFEVTAKGTDERALLYRQPLYVDDPIVSPDGELIAFVGDSTFLEGTEPAEGAIALYVMRSDGTHVRKLAEVLGGVAGDIAWQPIPGGSE